MGDLASSLSGVEVKYITGCEERFLEVAISAIPGFPINSFADQVMTSFFNLSQASILYLQHYKYCLEQVFRRGFDSAIHSRTDSTQKNPEHFA